MEYNISAITSERIALSRLTKIEKSENKELAGEICGRSDSKFMYLSCNGHVKND